jgi:tRNA threonylcarbamoyladenosine biosynthesis protein TsaE
MEVTLSSLPELTAEATRFVGELAPSASGATLVTLSGELGAGKTSFSQAVAQALGVEEHVTSPTFVLMKLYALPDAALFKRLVHIDAYRLTMGADLSPLGFDEIVKDKDTLILLEWPEHVADALPETAHALRIEVVSDTVRRLTYGKND